MARSSFLTPRDLSLKLSGGSGGGGGADTGSVSFDGGGGGGGSGGGVILQGRSVLLTSFIDVRGGDGGYRTVWSSDHAGGGGGRVLIDTIYEFSGNQDDILIAGGSGPTTWSDGSPGTVEIVTTTPDPGLCTFGGDTSCNTDWMHFTRCSTRMCLPRTLCLT